jgi:hypothetical protein
MPMTEHADDRRLMRLLAAMLTILWAVTALAIASAYRPGGPVDIVVAMACFVPVFIADAGVVWPAAGLARSHRLTLVWVWIAAILFLLPVMYGIASTLTVDGPRSLVPSLEAAYGGAIALLATAFFSIVGLVHRRLGVHPLERSATIISGGAAVLLAGVAGLAFGLVALVNEQDVRAEVPGRSRFGPTETDVVPPFCDQRLVLGANARITIEAKSTLDNVDRGSARLDGHRSGIDESWGGSWEGLDHSGKQAYLREGALAWLNDGSSDPGAPGTTWAEVRPDPFGLSGAAALTMDGPPHAIADAPRGELVAEDLGLEVVEGARARHCRTFIDGDTAMDTFLPLRWLLDGDSTGPTTAIPRWRGEMDWWVFTDGELGMAAVEVSGSRAETDWQADGLRVVLEARLQATDRDVPVEVSAPLEADVTSGPTLESETP